MIIKKFTDDCLPLCDTCEIDLFRTNNYYMVPDELWAKIAGKWGMLCIPCAEAVLGRPFKEEEITMIGFNNG